MFWNNFVEKSNNLHVQSRPQYGDITVFWMNLWGNGADGIWWKFGYTNSVTSLTVSASHFHQIIVHYRIAPAILLPSTTFSWFSKLRPHDLDCCAICSICQFWDANWASLIWCKFHVDRTTGKRVLKPTELIFICFIYQENFPVIRILYRRITFIGIQISLFC